MSTSEVPAFGFSQVVATRRLINDSIANGAQRLNRESPFEFLCECGDQACRRVVELSAVQFYSCRPGAIIAHESPHGSAPTAFSPGLREVIAEA